MSEIEIINLSNTTLFISGYVQGLCTEKDRVTKIFFKILPEAILISISEDELDGLKKIIEDKDIEIGLSIYEETFAKKLASYGDVKVPPEELLELINISRDKNIPMYCVDWNDDNYAKNFVENVSFLEWILQGLKIKKLRKKKFKSETPEEFVIEWDRIINKYKGFKNLEKKRAKYMAEKIIEYANNYKKILVFIAEARKKDVYEEITKISAGK